MAFYEIPDPIAAIVLAAILGAILGSFLNCAAYRIAHKQSFTTGRSRCPKCGHSLGVWDLIPVLSWVFLGGRCRHCHHRISPRYVLTELAFAALTAACVYFFGLTALALRNLIFIACLFLLSLVDLDTYEIPNGALITAALAWAVMQPLLWQGWTDCLLHVAAGAVYGGAMLGISMLLDRILQKESMGGGDIKLFAVVGLYLGFLPALFALILACVLGLLQALVSGKRNHRHHHHYKKKEIPFGPAISAATTAMLFFGEELAARYLALF